MKFKTISITANKKNLRITLNAPVPDGATVKVAVFSPVFQDGKYAIDTLVPQVNGADLVIDRYACGRDGLCLMYSVQIGNNSLPGVRYVTDIEESDRTFSYPETTSKKGLQISDSADAKILGVQHSAINVNEGDFLMLTPEEGNTIEFVHEGRTFYFRKSHVMHMDMVFHELTEIGVCITFILLNSPRWRCDIDPAFWEIIKHPAYTGKAEDGTGLISAFNLVTEEGLAYYRAFIAFLTDRYTRENKQFGRVVGMIVGNEVDAGYIWGNAGEVPMKWYMNEYTIAMRVAWQTAADIYANMRVYISLDHFWSEEMDAKQPLRYYKPKEMLEFLSELCAEEGDFPWHIAHHPYPEDLNFPDFWNDKAATPDDDAPIITFKNLEVLARFMYRPEMLYRGERRRIILSEQGFNSHWTPESEILQACAYGRAYRKVMEIPEIDSFILHAHYDNRLEFGLNLGLWRRKKEGHGMEAPKPMYYVFKAIDQKDEKGVYHWERY